MWYCEEVCTVQEFGVFKSVWCGEDAVEKAPGVFSEVGVFFLRVGVGGRTVLLEARIAWSGIDGEESILLKSELRRIPCDAGRMCDLSRGLQISGRNVQSRDQARSLNTAGADPNTKPCSQRPASRTFCSVAPFEIKFDSNTRLVFVSPKCNARN
jgi:hypothetical protein